MTPAEVAATLRAFNDWRRGGDIEYPGPLTVDEAIDAAVEMIDRLEAAEKERDDLRAKIEAMEKQEPVAWQTRTRPAWNDGTWGPWRKCSKEYAEDIKKTPSLHDWLYEARALYALQGAKGEEEEK